LSASIIPMFAGVTARPERADDGVVHILTRRPYAERFAVGERTCPVVFNPHRRWADPRVPTTAGRRRDRDRAGLPRHPGPQTWSRSWPPRSGGLPHSTRPWAGRRVHARLRRDHGDHRRSPSSDGVSTATSGWSSSTSRWSRSWRWPRPGSPTSTTGSTAGRAGAFPVAISGDRGCRHGLAPGVRGRNCRRGGVLVLSGDDRSRTGPKVSG